MGMLLRRHRAATEKPAESGTEDAPQADKPAGRSRTRKAPKGDA